MSGGPRVLLISALTVLLAGCVDMHPTRSGFLTDYGQLEPLGRFDRIRFMQVDPAALAEVDSFYIEEVAWLADDLGQPASSDKKRAAISEALQWALANELEPIRPVVGVVGPRTALVRAAVTGVQESKPLANLVVLVQTGPLFNGAASAEIEVISPDGVQIAAESVAYRGYEWDLVGFFTRSKHAESAMRRAARRLAGDLSLECSK